MQKWPCFKFFGAKSKEFFKILAPNIFSFVSEHFLVLLDDPNFYYKWLRLILTLIPDFEPKFNYSWRNHRIWKTWLLNKSFLFLMLKLIIFLMEGAVPKTTEPFKIVLFMFLNVYFDHVFNAASGYKTNTSHSL